MSNGSAGIGAVSIKQDEGAYTIGVGQAWSSADNWVTVSIDRDGKPLCEWDVGYDQARELAALLLTAADNEDLAVAIPGALAEIAAKERIREDAYTALRQAKRAAEQEFVNATVPQQESFDAALTAAEKAFADATGETTRTSRFVSLDKDPAGLPF